MTTMNILLLLLTLLLPSSVLAVTYTLGSTTYLVETFPLPTVTDTSPLPLAITMSRDNTTVWLICEFDRRIYSLPRTATDQTTMTAHIVSAPTSPLFRMTLAGRDLASFISNGGEHIQTTPDGSVWAAQGGHLLYTGTGTNWSRLVRRKADGSWQAFTLPFNSSGLMGFYVDDNSDYIWAAAAGVGALYTTRLRWWRNNEADPTLYPPVEKNWLRATSFGSLAPGLPAKFSRLNDGRFIGGLYFGNAYFILDPRTDTLTRFPLPATSLPVGSGPWEVRQASDGSVWIAEDYAQRVTRVAQITTGTQVQYDLSASLGTYEHPHSVAFEGTDAIVTTYSTLAGTEGRLVRITANGTVSVGASFTTLGYDGGIAGIVRDGNGALWITLFREGAIARLTPQ